MIYKSLLVISLSIAVMVNITSYLLDNIVMSICLAVSMRVFDILVREVSEPVDMAIHVIT